MDNPASAALRLVHRQRLHRQTTSTLTTTESDHGQPCLCRSGTCPSTASTETHNLDPHNNSIRQPQSPTMDNFASAALGLVDRQRLHRQTTSTLASFDTHRVRPWTTLPRTDSCNVHCVFLQLFIISRAAFSALKNNDHIATHDNVLLRCSNIVTLSTCCY